MNLFEIAKDSQGEKSKKADNKTIVDVVNDEFFDKVQEFETLQDRMKRDKAKADVINGELKDMGKDEWIKLYKETGKNPGTITLQAENTEGDIASTMYVPSDKYITIDKTRSANLRKEYGNDIVNEETTYVFDNKMLEKYGAVISKLILESEEIENNDKPKIIKGETSYSIKKGTIENLAKYGDVEKIFEEVKPIVSLKNAEIIKG